MGIGRTQRMVAGTLGVSVALMVVISAADVAGAVSSGGYQASKQGCPEDSSANTFTGAYPGCHNTQVLLTDSKGHTYTEAGLGQLADGQNVHSGTFLVTPNGDGNAYGNPKGSPYPAGCPGAADYQPADPGQRENDRSCPPRGASPASAVTGPGVGGSFDTNYQPVPSGQCGAEDMALYAAEVAQYLAGVGSKPCSFDPTKWTAPSSQPTLDPWSRLGVPDTAATQLITSGGELYLGADDNSDTGEHDGVDGQYGSGSSYNGPSDGGNLSIDWQPLAGLGAMAGWTRVLQGAAAGSPAALAAILVNPVPVANGGLGFCADGICSDAGTNQRTVYQGGGGNGQDQRDVYNYQGKDFGPYDCNSGAPSNEKACTTEPGGNGKTAACPPGAGPTADCGMNAYRRQDAKHVTTEPGAGVFADPDPQASPALPPQLDPLPAAFVGTCGAVVGGGGATAPALPSSAGPLSPVVSVNSAGQLVVADPTGC